MLFECQNIDFILYLKLISELKGPDGVWVQTTGPSNRPLKFHVQVYLHPGPLH